MTKYRNLSGQSGVLGYDLGADSIMVYFSDGSAYLYTYTSAGAANIEEMKRLAVAGSGLNSFIMRVVKKMYSKKVR
jgi:hypothetical protein